MTRKDKAGWLQSLVRFLLLFVFLVTLHKLTTPVQGAFLGIASVVIVLLSHRLIERWRDRPLHAQQTGPNTPTTQDTHV